ncbi:MAG: beta-lactamase family protein [Chloroflexota bacterium]|nr:beta-lactamase family protein [Chloroflexota bacterium]
MDDANADRVVPAVSVAVMRDGRLAAADARGTLLAGGGQRCTAETVFQACSISKPVAAAAALALVDAGALELDHDVNDLLTSWRLPVDASRRPITLRQLLSHTAGLTYCWYPGYAVGEPVPSLVQILNGEPPANTPPVVVELDPGAEPRYSGSHYSVVQQLIVDVAGRPFEDVVRELVLEPIGMSFSGYGDAFPRTHAGGAARGHDASGAVVPGGWRVMPEMAAAGLWTTPADLIRFAAEIAAAFRGESLRVVRPETARAMLAPGAGGRGLGFLAAEVDDDVRFGHPGDSIGYACELVAFARRGVGAAVMVNAEGSDDVIHGERSAIAARDGWPALVKDVVGATGFEPATS